MNQSHQQLIESLIVYTYFLKLIAQLFFRLLNHCSLEHEKITLFHEIFNQFTYFNLMDDGLMHFVFKMADLRQHYHNFHSVAWFTQQKLKQHHYY
jgi:hypothetical protein